MSGNNFFKLILRHKVVIDFNNDHQESMALYRDSYSYLNQLEHDLGNKESYEEAVEFYRNINRTRWS